MENIILVKQTLLYSMVETNVKFIKARSYSEAETPDRSVVTIAWNRQQQKTHFSTLVFILLFDLQVTQADGKHYSG